MFERIHGSHGTMYLNQLKKISLNLKLITQSETLIIDLLLIRKNRDGSKEITNIFFDVDGIFTDGSLYISDNKITVTKFNVHDGMGCILLREIGIELLILTARHSDGDSNVSKIWE